MKERTFMHREEIEQFAFLYLCGLRDRKLVSGKEKMTFSDFDRLIYISAFLGLIHFNLKMWNQYCSRFQTQLKRLEHSCETRNVPLCYDEYEDDIRQQEQWLADFCDNAPDQKAREYLRSVLKRAGE